MSNMMQEIKKSIHTNALTWTTVKKCYYTQAIQNTTFPYVVFYGITDIENGSDTKDKYYDIKIQFNAFSVKNDNGDEAQTIIEEIESAIKNLSVSTYKIIRIKRDFSTPSIFIDKVWRAVIQFNVHITT